MAGAFAGKVAIVTGGGSGIGEALCAELARRGAHVIVADIREEDADRVAAAIGGKAESRHVDVTAEADVRGLVEATATAYGHLDYMFSNAGIAIGGDARDITLEHWRKVLDVDLYGVLYGSLAAYQIMARQGFGHIVNVASAAGLIPLPISMPYSTAKHAVVGFSRSLRLEAADLGVRVSVVCPGWIRTAIYQNAIAVNLPADATTPKVKMVEPARAAREILDGVARNAEIIVFPASIRALRRVHFFFPGLIYPPFRRAIREARRQRIDPAAES
jgi:NAD(P)-dependent dehydrogenase (short-subunit alcohol dehydrogenase family)